MTNADSAPAMSGMIATRPSASRKLLSRKAVERGERSTSAAEAIEDSFPQTGPEMPAPDTISRACCPQNYASFIGPRPSAQAPAIALTPAPLAPRPVVLSANSSWSYEDETAFQSLSARRRAAGYNSRGKDIGSQRIGLGRIKPNPETIVAVIAAIIAERGGSIPRAELVNAMAGATFQHPKAQPTDRSWCQGYIAGAVRNGFLTAATALAQSAGAA